MCRTKSTKYPCKSNRGKVPRKHLVTKSRTDPSPRGVKKTRPVTFALREVRRFQYLVREIALAIKPDLRFRSAAVKALKEASETFLVDLFEDAVLCAILSDTDTKRVTVTPKHINLTLRMQGGVWRP